MRYLALILLLAGCTSKRQWEAAVSSTRLEYGHSYSEYESTLGHSRFDGDGYWVGVSIQPFAGWEPAKEVIVRDRLPNEDTGTEPYMKPAHEAVDDGHGNCARCGQALPK